MSKKDKFVILEIEEDELESKVVRNNDKDELDYIDKEKSMEEKQKELSKKADPNRIPSYYRAESGSGINRSTIDSILGKSTTDKDKIREELARNYKMCMDNEVVEEVKTEKVLEIVDPLKEMREKEEKEKQSQDDFLSDENLKEIENIFQGETQEENDDEDDLPDELDDEFDSEYDKEEIDDPYYDEPTPEEEEEEVVINEPVKDIVKEERKTVIEKQEQKEENNLVMDDFGNFVPQTPNVERGGRRRDRDVVDPELAKKIKFGDKKRKYIKPPFELLNKNGTNTPVNSSSVNYQISVINRTLADFKVGGKVINYTKGPTVTQFEIKLDPGVNVNKVSAIQRNLQMNLESETIRMECPIPGKSTIGVEVPNIEKDKVIFGDLVTDEKYLNDGKPLNVILGLSIDGRPIYANIGEMPHCLIAGATGGGKTVCIYSVVTSMIYKASPEEVKMVLIDPKRNELVYFEDIPHLATPIIDDPKLATASLKWAVEEMDRRYDFLKANRKRTIGDYNDYAVANGLKIIPYIVIVIDEFADLMTNASESFEVNVQRLTQKARSAGIHLVIATQRPSTDVIKGTIKANIPTRIAFQVQSPVDSMTILDHTGADKLLGKGDMLYTKGNSDTRIQGAYISESELDNISTYFYEQDLEPNYIFTHDELRTSIESDNNGGNGESDMEDELLEEIARFVFLNKKASANQIQTTYEVGYNRAIRIINTLAKLGIVSSENIQGKARQVIVNDIDELEQILRDR